MTERNTTLGGLIRHTVQPVWRRTGQPVWRRVWQQIERRLAPVERRMDALQAHTDAVTESTIGWVTRLDAIERRMDAVQLHANAVAESTAGWVTRLNDIEVAWRQHVPAFLNAVGTVSALAHALAATRQRLDEVGSRLDGNDAATKALWERIEFVRREILFEMAHGAGRTQATPTAAMARIVDPRKLEAMRSHGALRLNLGAGHIAASGYINVDRRALPGIDLVAEADALPFELGTIDEITSAHLLEHVPDEAMRRRYLPHWLSLLRPGGVFRAVTPDARAMLAAAAAGTYDFAEFREVLFGAQDYEGDYHYNIFTPDSLAALLRDAGLIDIEVPVAGRRNGKCFEFEITAVRP